ncbi:MAG: diaminopimelate epimerase [Syntrophobacteraceae bacterium]|nr:diaminopimelate epimerase [Syntrophobacteraceae bacterium]
MSEKRHTIRFTKMTGSGNDFVIIDNRELKISGDSGRELARLACRRKLSAGADGLILIENDPEADFAWRFFNADGSEAEMCGNGARCAARFALLKGITKKERFSFRTLAGVVEAEVLGRTARVAMPRPRDLEADISLDIDGRRISLDFLNTGVPHAVHFIDSPSGLKEMDIDSFGRAIRRHERFQPAGTNADFVFVAGPHNMQIRTYERGVEGETLACGTGCIAAALVAAARNYTETPVDMLTRSGETLTIHFEKISQGSVTSFSSVFLEGDAKVVYDAELWDETLKA